MANPIGKNLLRLEVRFGNEVVCVPNKRDWIEHHIYFGAFFPNKLQSHLPA